jgi:hypothetical protein
MSTLWHAAMGPTRDPDRRLVFLLALLAVFTLFRTVRIEGWDDAFYVAQLTSVVGDGDLMLQDDLLAVRNTPARRLETIVRTLDSGAPVNTFSIGPAIVHSSYLWPVVRRTADLAGAFRILLAIGSMACLAVLVLAVAAWLAGEGYEGWPLVFAAALPVAWSPLLVYATRSYLGSHLLAACAAALLLLAAQRWVDAGGRRHAAAFGLAAGLLVAIRWQDALVPMALVPWLALSWLRAENRARRARELALGVALSILPVAAQMLAFRAQFGRAWLVPQGAGYMRWTDPAWSAFLLSPFHGVLPWAPGLALGLAGLVWAAVRAEPRRRPLYLGLIVLVPIAFYVNAAVRDWWGGESFGPRRLSTLVPLAALGWAALFRALPRRASVTLAIVLSLWAVMAASAFYSGWDDLSALARGVPAVDNPTDAARYAGLHWIDRWGPLHALKPGFTFSDRPTNVDRAIGLVITAVVLLAVAAAWRAASRRPRVQAAAVALVAAWVLGWIVLLARVPSNAVLDARWREVVRGAATDLAPLPSGVQAAAQLVSAARAAAAGRDDEAVRRLAQARSPQFPALTLEDLRAAAADPSVRPLLTGAPP